MDKRPTVVLCGLEDVARDIVRCTLFGIRETSLQFRDLPSKPVRLVAPELDENMTLDADIVIVAHTDSKEHNQEDFARFLGTLKHSVIPTAAIIFVCVCDSDTVMYDEGAWAKIRAMFKEYVHLKAPQLLPASDVKAVEQLKAVVYTALDTHDDPPMPTCPLCFFWPSLA